MTNQEYVKKLRKSLELVEIYSKVDLIEAVLGWDSEYGDGRIRKYQENFFDLQALDLGDCSSMCAEFNETIMDPQWQPGANWLQLEKVEDNELPF